MIVPTQRMDLNCTWNWHDDNHGAFKVTNLTYGILILVWGAFTSAPESYLEHQLDNYNFCKPSLRDGNLIGQLLDIMFIFRCIVTHLADPVTFLMDHLLLLKPVKFLEGELIHDVSNHF